MFVRMGQIFLSLKIINVLFYEDDLKMIISEFSKIQMSSTLIISREIFVGFTKLRIINEHLLYIVCTIVHLLACTCCTIIHKLQVKHSQLISLSPIYQLFLWPSFKKSHPETNVKI